MGTNFYLNSKPCDHCGLRKVNDLHIGKSSVGWVFTLRGYEQDEFSDLPTPQTLDEWIALFNDPQYEITDEYSRPLTTEQMLSRILEREARNPSSSYWLPYGVFDTEVGLARSQTDKYHRIEQVKGKSYSIHFYEFS